MKITVNGENKNLPSELSPYNLINVLKELGYQPQLIVVEYNGKILSSNFWEEQIVNDGDNLEIVTIVGGGY